MTVTSKADYKDFLKLSYRMTYKKIWFISAFALLSLFYNIPVLFTLSWSELLESSKNNIFGFTMLFTLLLITITTPIAIHKNTKKMFSHIGKMNETRIYEFTSDKIQVKGETFSAEILWQNVHHIVEMKSWLSIYHDKLIAYHIPKKDIGTDLQALKELIRSKTFIKQKLKK